MRGAPRERSGTFERVVEAIVVLLVVDVDLHGAAEADQIMFSVRLNGTCLIGQYGGGRYNGTAQPLLSTGTCLVGATRPIDW